MVISALVLFGLYKLVNSVGMKMVACSQQQAVAIEKLTQAIEDSISKDNNDHREIIILLKVISEKIERIENREIDSRLRIAGMTAGDINGS